MQLLAAQASVKAQAEWLWPGHLAGTRMREENKGGLSLKNDRELLDYGRGSLQRNPTRSRLDFSRLAEPTTNERQILQPALESYSCNIQGGGMSTIKSGENSARRNRNMPIERAPRRAAFSGSRTSLTSPSKRGKPRPKRRPARLSRPKWVSSESRPRPQISLLPNAPPRAAASLPLQQSLP